MILFLQIILIITSLALMALILLHRGKGGGLSSMFGGSMQASLSGSSVVERNLDRLTLMVAAIWFIAIVGISSGPTFVAGLKEAGFGLFFWGLFATAVPMLIAPYIGKYIFRFDDAINLGCCGGARTSTASVAMVGEVARSDVPMLGYTVPYAVSNTLLTLWGLVIVLLVM